MLMISKGAATPKHQRRQAGWPERSRHHNPNHVQQQGKEKQRNSSNNFIYPPNSYHGKSGNQMSLCHIRFILTLNNNVT